MVRQLEALVDNLKHDKEIMREEQMNYETTTEEVVISDPSYILSRTYHQTKAEIRFLVIVDYINRTRNFLLPLWIICLDFHELSLMNFPLSCCHKTSSFQVSAIM